MFYKNQYLFLEGGGQSPAFLRPYGSATELSPDDFEDNFSEIVHFSSDVSETIMVAGVHVLRGVGYVNVSDSRIAFNIGDGLNISYTGGIVNVTRSSLSSNKGFGLSVW